MMKMNSCLLIACFCTDLRKCEERGDLVLPALFIFLAVLSVLLYFAVALMDPGFVLTDAVKVDITHVTNMCSTIISIGI